MAGRPRIKLDEALLERLASIHCTNTEMAAAMGVSVDTLTRNYADLMAKGREKGKITLRRLQFDAAQKGNVTMMIWLGKQLLGQRDQAGLELTGVRGGPLQSESSLSPEAEKKLDRVTQLMETLASERRRA